MRIWIVLVFLFLLSCQNESMMTIYYNDKEINVELAQTTQEITTGLMNREYLEPNSGMLFIFDDEDHRSFWMKNTLIPLDLIFMNEDYLIVDIKKNFQPCKENPCEKYISKQPTKYVLEVKSGFVDDNDIEIGHKMDVR